MILGAVGKLIDQLFIHFCLGASFASPSYHPTVLLPHTNLPLMLPLWQDQPPHNFSVKDQHLLKPPPAMGAAGGFGRRASDGGANLQTFFQKNIEHSDWSTVQQHQQQQQIAHMDAVLSNKLALNGQSTSTHASGSGSPSTELFEDSSNSGDLKRYSALRSNLQHCGLFFAFKLTLFRYIQRGKRHTMPMAKPEETKGLSQPTATRTRKQGLATPRPSGT